ncbi:MAG: hypothetical protein AAF840_03205 [Bacteroidota bacterium]
MINPNFGWQPRFDDRILRKHGAYDRVSRYIFDNPKNWSTDTFYD